MSGIDFDARPGQPSDSAIKAPAAQVRNHRRLPTGVRLRHSRKCSIASVGRCTCRPSYEARVWSTRDRREILKSFRTLAAAKAWRVDTASAVQRGQRRASKPVTIREAADELIAGMRSGAIRNRSGEVYKPSVIEAYEDALRALKADFGSMRVTQLDRIEVQAFVDRMLAEKKSPSTVRNALLPLRVIYRRALHDGIVGTSPCTNLRLPAVRGGRERAADPSEAAALIAAVPQRDRALWATAFYSGLRVGELRALRWSDVDLAGGEIHVEGSWCTRTNVVVSPKSAAGRRTVPIGALLRDYLAEHRAANTGDGYVFASRTGRPVEARRVQGRADRAWLQLETGPLARLTFHEARHTCASLYIAAGANAKTIQEILGHSSITITLDRYGHLFDESRRAAATKLDAYLHCADTARRVEQLS